MTELFRVNIRREAHIPRVADPNRLMKELDRKRKAAVNEEFRKAVAEEKRKKEKAKLGPKLISSGKVLIPPEEQKKVLKVIKKRERRRPRSGYYPARVERVEKYIAIDENCLRPRNRGFTYNEDMLVDLYRTKRYYEEKNEVLTEFRRQKKIFQEASPRIWIYYLSNCPPCERPPPTEFQCGAIFDRSRASIPGHLDFLQCMAPVQIFQQAPLNDIWLDQAKLELPVEMRNTFVPFEDGHDTYWAGRIEVYAGYFALVKFATIDEPKDKDLKKKTSKAYFAWINFCSDQLKEIAQGVLDGCSQTQLQEIIPMVQPHETIPPNLADYFREKIRIFGDHYDPACLVEITDPIFLDETRLGKIGSQRGNFVFVVFFENPDEDGDWEETTTPYGLDPPKEELPVENTVQVTMEFPGGSETSVKMKIRPPGIEIPGKSGLSKGLGIPENVNGLLEKFNGIAKKINGVRKGVNGMSENVHGVPDEVIEAREKRVHPVAAKLEEKSETKKEEMEESRRKSKKKPKTSTNKDGMWVSVLNSDRIHRYGWSNAVGIQLNGIPPEVNEDFWLTAADFKKLRPLPFDVQKDMKVEVRHPKRPHKIVGGIIQEVLRYGHVMIETREKSSSTRQVFVLNVHSPFILPWGWGDAHNVLVDYVPEDFDEKEPLGLDVLYPRNPHEFKVGMKLEAVHPLTCDFASRATIIQVAGHLLLVHFDGTPKRYGYVFWVDATQGDIFPAGYSDLVGMEFKEYC